jgi:hypothetical protein
MNIFELMHDRYRLPLRTATEREVMKNARLKNDSLRQSVAWKQS